jgi:hypothetical protein
MAMSAILPEAHLQQGLEQRPTHYQARYLFNAKRRSQNKLEHPEMFNNFTEKEENETYQIVYSKNQNILC